MYLHAHQFKYYCLLSSYLSKLHPHHPQCSWCLSAWLWWTLELPLVYYLLSCLLLLICQIGTHIYVVAQHISWGCSPTPSEPSHLLLIFIFLTLDSNQTLTLYMFLTSLPLNPDQTLTVYSNFTSCIDNTWQCWLCALVHVSTPTHLKTLKSLNLLRSPQAFQHPWNAMMNQNLQ